MSSRSWLARALAVGGLVALSAVIFLTVPASAQVYVDVPPPKVGPTAGEPAPQVKQAVQQRPVAVAAARRAPARGLAITGADVIGLCALAAGAVVVGVVAVRTGRRVPAP